MLDRSISSTITVGGATNAGTFEAAELMVAGMNAREASGVLFEQNLVVADSESTRRRLATATTKHLSFLEDDALSFRCESRVWLGACHVAGSRHRVLRVRGLCARGCVAAAGRG